MQAEAARQIAALVWGDADSATRLTPLVPPKGDGSLTSSSRCLSGRGYSGRISSRMANTHPVSFRTLACIAPACSAPLPDL